MAIAGTIAGAISRSIVGALTDAFQPGGGGGGGGAGTTGPWDLTTLTAAETGNFQVRNYQSEPRAVWFKPDGTSFFTLGIGSARLLRWDMSTAWDVTSTGAVAVSMVGLLADTQPSGLWIAADGSFFVYVGDNGNDVHKHAMPTPWDPSSASSVPDSTYDMTSDGVTSPTAVHFNGDGTKMFVMEAPATYLINEFTLSTAYDPSTATFVGDFNLGTGSGNAYQHGLWINSTEIYVNTQADTIHKWTFDGNTVASIVYDSSQGYTQVQSAPRGLWMNDDWVAYMDWNGLDQVHIHAWGPHS